MEVYLSARFGEFVAVPEIPRAEYRNRGCLFVKIDSPMEELMYRRRVILRVQETARGVLSDAYDFAIRLGDLAIQSLQELRPMRIGATPIDEEIRGAILLTRVVFQPRVNLARSPRPVGALSKEYAAAEAANPVQKAPVARPAPALDIGCVQRGLSRLVL